MSKFAATYFINKCFDGDDGDFIYELLDLNTMFDNVYEEPDIVGEHTETWDTVTHDILKEYTCGVYQVFVIGDIEYRTDYWGEYDVDVELNYWVVRELPETYVEFELLGNDE